MAKTSKKTKKSAIPKAVSPRKNDVMFGRGGGTNHHEGNKIYRQLIRNRALEYNNAPTTPRRYKTNIIAGIIQAIHSRQGRFIEKVDEHDETSWVEATPKRIKTKVSQALRDDNKDVNKLSPARKMLPTPKAKAAGWGLSTPTNNVMMVPTASMEDGKKNTKCSSAVQQPSLMRLSVRTPSQHNIKRGLEESSTSNIRFNAASVTSVNDHHIKTNKTFTKAPVGRPANNNAVKTPRNMTSGTTDHIQSGSKRRRGLFIEKNNENNRNDDTREGNASKRTKTKVSLDLSNENNQEYKKLPPRTMMKPTPKRNSFRRRTFMVPPSPMTASAARTPSTQVGLSCAPRSSSAKLDEATLAKVTGPDIEITETAARKAEERHTVTPSPKGNTSLAKLLRDDIQLDFLKDWQFKPLCERDDYDLLNPKSQLKTNARRPLGISEIDSGKDRESICTCQNQEPISSPPKLKTRIQRPQPIFSRSNSSEWNSLFPDNVQLKQAFKETDFHPDKFRWH